MAMMGNRWCVGSIPNHEMIVNIWTMDHSMGLI